MFPCSQLNVWYGHAACTCTFKLMRHNLKSKLCCTVRSDTCRRHGSSVGSDQTGYPSLPMSISKSLIFPFHLISLPSLSFQHSRQFNVQQSRLLTPINATVRAEKTNSPVTANIWSLSGFFCGSESSTTLPLTFNRCSAAFQHLTNLSQCVLRCTCLIKTQPHCFTFGTNTSTVCEMCMSTPWD